MKKYRLIFRIIMVCLFFSSSTKGQRADYEISRDTITQWIYHNNIIKKTIYKPVVSSGSTYTAWQQTVPDSLQRWVQASFNPRGSAFDIRYNKVQDFIDLKGDNGSLHMYGLEYHMFPASYSKLKNKLDVGGEAPNVLSIYANGPVGEHVKTLSTNGRKWFIATQIFDLKSIQDGATDNNFINELKEYPSMAPYLHLCEGSQDIIQKHSIILAPNNKLPFTKVTIADYLQAFEEFTKSRVNSSDPNYQLPEEYVLEELKKVTQAKVRFTNELAEPVQFTGNNEYYDPANISNGTNSNKEIFEIYQLSSEATDLMKKEKPLWINITIERRPDYLMNYHVYQSFCKNFNLDYLYKYFFDPDKVKNLAYSPLYTPLKVLPPKALSSERSAKWKTEKENNAVIFFEDFSGNQIGTEPVGWFSKMHNGTLSSKFSTVQQAPNEKGLWLNLPSFNVAISNELNKTLGQNFTISFDIKCTDDYAWGSASVSFFLSDFKNNDEMLNGNFGLDNLGRSANTSIKLQIRPAENNNEGIELSISKPVIGSRESDIRYYNRKISSFSGQRGSTIAKVMIQVKGAALYITVNNEKVLDEKNILPGGIVFSTMSWGASGSMMESNDKMYVSNIKISKD